MERARTASPLLSDQTAEGFLVIRWLARRLFALTARNRAWQSLGRLSDASLKDIGLTRNDVQAALGPGSSRDFSDQLARKAASRSGNW